MSEERTPATLADVAREAGVDESTARQAVAMARLEDRFPELPPSAFLEADLGIFGRRLRDPDAQPLKAGDRVEVYRPLEIDPKAARAARAAREKR